MRRASEKGSISYTSLKEVSASRKLDALTSSQFCLVRTTIRFIECIEMSRVGGCNGWGVNLQHVLIVGFGIFRKVVAARNHPVIIDDEDLMVHKVLLAIRIECVGGRSHKA